MELMSSSEEESVDGSDRFKVSKNKMKKEEEHVHQFVQSIMKKSRKFIIEDQVKKEFLISANDAQQVFIAQATKLI